MSQKKREHLEILKAESEDVNRRHTGNPMTRRKGTKRSKIIYKNTGKAKDWSTQIPQT